MPLAACWLIQLRLTINLNPSMEFKKGRTKLSHCHWQRGSCPHVDQCRSPNLTPKWKSFRKNVPGIGMPRHVSMVGLQAWFSIRNHENSAGMRGLLAPLDVPMGGGGISAGGALYKVGPLGQGKGATWALGGMGCAKGRMTGLPSSSPIN